MVSGSGTLLLAAIGGYWVLERAATHKGGLKQIGQLVGGLIIVTSLIGVACRVWAIATGKTSYDSIYSPFTPKGAMPPSPSQ